MGDEQATCCDATVAAFEDNPEQGDAFADASALRRCFSSFSVLFHAVVLQRCGSALAG